MGLAACAVGPILQIGRLQLKIRPERQRMRMIVFSRIALMVLGLIVTWIVIHRKEEPLPPAPRPQRKVTPIDSATRERLNLVANYARASQAQKGAAR